MASVQLFTCQDRVISILAKQKKNSVTGNNILLDFLFRCLSSPR